MTDNPNESTIRNHARFLVALGRHGYADIVRQCLEILDSPTDEDDQLARRIVADEFAAHLADQETWPDELDTDRLNRAFRELDMSGIVARLDHTCCQSCGISEIGEEFPEDEDPRGYVFAHRQDMESAVPGGGLTLSYGVLSHGRQPPEAQTEIGEEVAAALRRHGLDVDWNGSPKQRIEVSLDWKRRRFGPLADWPGRAPAPESDQPLSISYCDMPHRGVENAFAPMSFLQARDLMLTMTPYSGNYINFDTPSENGMVASWFPGPRLRFEIFDREKRTFSGRDVTIAEAEEIVRVLADEDRRAIPGELTES